MVKSVQQFFYNQMKKSVFIDIDVKDSEVGIEMSHGEKKCCCVANQLMK